MNLLAESQSRATNRGSAPPEQTKQSSGYETAGKPTRQSELELRSLLELAALVRKNVESNRRFLVWFDSKSCLLDFSEGSYTSQVAGSDLADFQDRPGMTIRVVEARNAARAALGARRRLDDFLWHLGLYSGSGKLLPWLSEKQAYRMSRWPSPLSNDGSNQTFRVAAMLCREDAKLEDIVRATGIPRATLADFLNACSLVGCLELADSQPAAKTVRSDAKKLAPKGALALNAIGTVILLAGMAALYLLLTAQPQVDLTPALTSAMSPPPAPPLEARPPEPGSAGIPDATSRLAALSLLQSAPRERFHLGTALTPGVVFDRAVRVDPTTFATASLSSEAKTQEDKPLAP